MSKKLYIESYCRIRDNKVIVDGKTVVNGDTATNSKEFFKSLYQQLNSKYPKFHKMDNLCKLAFISAEFMKDAINTDTAIVLMNNASSLDTDRVHQNSIQQAENRFSSPAVFVYTLPNIALGELSIRHKTQTENAFFIEECFDAKRLMQIANNFVETGNASSVLTGWVNFEDEKCDGLMYIVSEKGKFEYSEKKLISLYK